MADGTDGVFGPMTAALSVVAATVSRIDAIQAQLDRLEQKQAVLVDHVRELDRVVITGNGQDGLRDRVVELERRLRDLIVYSTPK